MVWLHACSYILITIDHTELEILSRTYFNHSYYLNVRVWLMHVHIFNYNWSDMHGLNYCGSWPKVCLIFFVEIVLDVDARPYWITKTYPWNLRFLFCEWLSLKHVASHPLLHLKHWLVVASGVPSDSPSITYTILFFMISFTETKLESHAH